MLNVSSAAQKILVTHIRCFHFFLNHVVFVKDRNRRIRLDAVKDPLSSRRWWIRGGVTCFFEIGQGRDEGGRWRRLGSTERGEGWGPGVNNQPTGWCLKGIDVLMSVVWIFVKMAATFDFGRGEGRRSWKNATRLCFWFSWWFHGVFGWWKRRRKRRGNTTINNFWRSISNSWGIWNHRGSRSWFSRAFWKFFLGGTRAKRSNRATKKVNKVDICRSGDPNCSGSSSVHVIPLASLVREARVNKRPWSWMPAMTIVRGLGGIIPSFPDSTLSTKFPRSIGGDVGVFPVPSIGISPTKMIVVSWHCHKM